MPRTYYIDETGFTGEDLLAPDQPLFVQATNNLSADEAKGIIEITFSGIQAAELKHARLSRRPQHRERIVELVGAIAAEPARAGTWIADKEFALVTLIVEWWIEPLAHQTGFNLYKDGANHAMANMLYCCLQGFWTHAFRRRLLLHFQRMFRSRTQERFSECEAFVRNAINRADDDRAETLRYLWPSFRLLGLRHVRSLPKQVLDIALSGLVLIGHTWRSRDKGPWDVVYDQSSTMAKQRWLWDALASPEMPAAQFLHPGGAAIFPMNVRATRFGDSRQEMQLQICDLLAGATSACFRQTYNQGYRDALLEAGIEKLNIGSIWPGTEVTPDELAKRGWDGNLAIEWINEQLKVQRAGEL